LAIKISVSVAEFREKSTVLCKKEFVIVFLVRSKKSVETLIMFPLTIYAATAKNIV
jgi:hypothetical protein